MNASNDDNSLDATRSMTAEGQNSPGDPLVEAMDEYLQAIETGEAVNREAFLDRYPQIKDELRECLEAMEFIDRAGPSPKATERTGQDSEPLQPLSALGDYRIICELGRGGMGVVYEAEQLSIGRKVALKVLPFAAVLDPKSLSRFKHEAQAAGALKHPHIVGVHAVGCERGVHYYAMELVEGKSLAQVIAGQQKPEAPPEPILEASTNPVAALSTKATSGTPEYFRSVAMLGVQAAEALDHAHERGIIHRDVKPSNLLIDGEGNLWVTDFGLAQIESDVTRLTMTGDLLGTLRYMSPEQAKGDRRRMDHRTDIYSLGITLYELLTGRPAFDGRDRGKLIHEIIESQPPAARKLNPAVPRDLETIVLKAIRKKPAERYSTAAEMAADLNRFLEHRAVLARRPSLANRLLRWCQRNRGMAILSACLILSVTISLIVLAQRGRITSPSVLPTSSEISLRLVHSGNVEVSGNISPDGKRLAYPNWDTGNIAFFNLESGGRSDLTTAGSWKQGANGYGEQAIWSHNSRRLAYGWYTKGEAKGKSASQLRVVEADGTNDRVVFQSKKSDVIWPVSWSGDGKQIFVQLADRKGTMTFKLINVTDGTDRTLASFETPFPAQFQLSLDGHYVVYSRSPHPDSKSLDLYLLNTQTLETSSLVAHPASDDAPYWTPDGRWIVFLSDRGGNTGLWAIRFRDGRAASEPRLIHARLDDIVPKGFDKRGSYYYAAWQSRSNVYTAEVDFANNAVIKAPEKLESKYEGRNTSAAWSPDGKTLAYLSRLGSQRFTPRLSLRDLKTGSESEIDLGSPLGRLSRHSDLHWTPDGKFVFITGLDAKGESGWFRVEISTGRASKLDASQPPDAPDSWSPSPDGRWLYASKRRQVIRFDIEKRTQQVLHQLAEKENASRGLKVSPDGTQLAVSIMGEDIRILSNDGKSVRTLYKAGRDGPVAPGSWALAWTPDGKRIVFGSQADDSEVVSLWQIPIEGGAPQALGITLPAIQAIRIHPDGRKLLFIAREPGSDGELWAIDNVLARLNSWE